MASNGIGVGVASSRNLNNIHNNSSSNNSTSSNSGVGLLASSGKMMKTPIAWSARDANLSSRPASTMAYNISSHYNIHNPHQHLHHHQQQQQQQQQLKIHSNSRLQGLHLPLHQQTSSFPVHQETHLTRHSKSRYHPNVLAARTPGQQQMQHHLNGHQRPSSPSATTITSSDDREEVPMVRHQRRPNHGAIRGVSSDRRSVISRASRAASLMPPPTSYEIYTGPHQIPSSILHPHLPPLGTLRSAKSVPALPYPGMDDQSTVGPGCPVHGGTLAHPHPHQFVYPHGDIHTATLMRRVGSVVDLRSLPPATHTLPLMPHPHHPHHPHAHPHHQIATQPHAATYSVVNFDTGKKGYRMGQLPLPPLPGISYHHPPAALMMGPGGLSATGKTLPVMASKSMADVYMEEATCCKGHLIVLWIILTVVTLGVISGIVLAVTMN